MKSRCLPWALCLLFCVPAVTLHAMSLAEREKMELKKARRPAPVAAPPAAEAAPPQPAKPVVAKKPPTIPYGIASLPDRFVPAAEPDRCGCSAYAQTTFPQKSLIFSADSRQGVLYRDGHPNFLPHLLSSEANGFASNLYGSTDLRIRTNGQRIDKAQCSAYREVPPRGYCADGTVDVVIDNETKKPIKAVFVCDC